MALSRLAVVISFSLLFMTMKIPARANSETTRWVINRDHSEINFSVEYLKFSTVSGRFSDFYGDVDFDHDLILPNSVDLRIRVNSIFSANNLRDSHLKGPEFLHAKRFPFIYFSSKTIHAIAPERFKVDGQLTIRDITRPLTIEIEMSAPVQDTWKFTSKFAKFKGSINRQEFGINWNKTLDQQAFILGDQIEFYGVLQLQPSGHKSSGNRHLIPDSNSVRRLERLQRGEIAQEPMPEAGRAESFSAPPELINDEPEQIAPAAAPTTSINHWQRDWRWWSAFVVLGLLGFLASLLIAFHARMVMSNFLARHEAETVWMNISADVLTILFMFLYALAYWYVGWGET